MACGSPLRGPEPEATAGAHALPRPTPIQLDILTRNDAGLHPQPW
ncbi:hypothetical protein SFR_0006 [Streptomyces sp. FR-008]|nr:hypothetical protein SFR_0006 [Streptomyces sp. FR-008]